MSLAPTRKINGVLSAYLLLEIAFILVQLLERGVCCRGSPRNADAAL
jgi:hypothetical protein